VWYHGSRHRRPCIEVKGQILSASTTGPIPWSSWRHHPIGGVPGLRPAEASTSNGDRALEEASARTSRTRTTPRRLVAEDQERSPALQTAPLRRPRERAARVDVELFLRPAQVDAVSGVGSVL